MPKIEDAIALALESHWGETDKGGAPYILHPLRLAVHLDNEEEQITAALHDVVEDSGVTLEQLRKAGYSESVVAALECLTKRDGESYDAFVQRIKPNDLARRVKVADITDNMDMSRIAEPTDADFERLEKYEQALAFLNDVP